jgi:hypothetical protein
MVYHSLIPGLVHENRINLCANLRWQQVMLFVLRIGFEAYLLSKRNKMEVDKKC